MTEELSTESITLPLTDAFDLDNTFLCGQCFRWEKNPDGSFSGIAAGGEVTVDKTGQNLRITGSSPSAAKEFWEDYLDLHTDYCSIREELSRRCPALAPAMAEIDGIHILRQNPWEALCSFIISQNNHIPRIKGIILRLCQQLGKPMGSGYCFPVPEVLAGCTVEDLAPLRAGFRAKYIIDAAQKVVSGQVDLSRLYTAPLPDCRQELKQIKGVGDKVAECTLLYGFHRLEAFPVDVWMKKALNTSFCGIQPEELGQYAGIAQQYIFHYTRLQSLRIS